MMFKRVLCLCVIALALFNCESNSLFTEEEQIAAHKITDFYGGRFRMMKGHRSGDDKRIPFFRLEMENSELLGTEHEMIGAFARNVAYLFYSEIGERQHDYEEIQIQLKLKNGKTLEYTVEDEVLLDMERLMPNILEANRLLMERDVTALGKLFHPSTSYDSSAFSELLDSIETSYGALSGFQIQGLLYFDEEVHGPVMGAFIGQNRNAKDLPVILIIERQTGALISIQYY